MSGLTKIKNSYKQNGTAKKTRSIYLVKEIHEITELLKILFRKDVEWNWNKDPDEAFTHLKEKLISPQMLKYYDVD